VPVVLPATDSQTRLTRRKLLGTAALGAAEGENVYIHDGMRSTYPAVPGLPNPPKDPRVIRERSRRS
jgi:hypothetical protein